MRTGFTLISVAVLFVAANAHAGGAFYGITNELGYSGTVWNITDGTGPWPTSSPRNANLFTVVGAPQIWTDYNQLMSSWFEHLPSNQNDSFLQLADGGNTTVTAASAEWDASLTVFTMTVTGKNATYENSWSRFWQPDQNMAWGVTFIDYVYTFTATFAAPATVDAHNFLVSSGSPTAISGSFTGVFQSTRDVNKQPITNGDQYGFNIAFSKSMFDPHIRDYYGYGGGQAFWAGLALMGAVAWKRYRRSTGMDERGCR